MAAPASPEVFKRSTNRRLYTWVAIGAALTVFAGFARTYYQKSFYTTPSPNHPVLPALLHIHGLVMTTWFVLFIVQVRLIAAHRADLHRRLGVAGAILAGLVVAIDIGVSLRNVHRLFIAQAGSTRALGFLAINFGALLSFGILVATAVLLRRRPDYHKRFMTLACLSILGAAIDPLPLTLPFLGFLDSFSQCEMFGVWDIWVAVCIAADALKNRRLHPAWIWGARLVVGLQVTAGAVRYTSSWQQFAAWLVR
jgi:hypothetical protein